MKRVFAAVLLVLLLMPVVEAATVSGSLYDLSLQKVSDAKVTVDTEPRQQIITRNGSYSFEVPAGSYTIVAEGLGAKKLKAEENITVAAEGSFTLDFVLFPVFEEQDIIEQADIEPVAVAEASTLIILIQAAVSIAILAVLAIYIIRTRRAREEKPAAKKEPEEEAKPQETKGGLPQDLQQIVDYMKGVGGRTTQKDIRKEFGGLSEAKISLMVADLESRGIVKKIKKGRGNILVLK